MNETSNSVVEEDGVPVIPAAPAPEVAETRGQRAKRLSEQERQKWEDLRATCAIQDLRLQLAGSRQQCGEGVSKTFVVESAARRLMELQQEVASLHRVLASSVHFTHALAQVFVSPGPHNQEEIEF